MNSKIRHTTNMLGTAHGYCLDHPLVPPSAKATAYIAEIGTAYTTMLALGGAQSGGTADWRNGTDQRSLAAQKLHDRLLELVKTARALDTEQYPEAGAIRMPVSPGLQALRDRAQAVLGAIGPIKAAFVDADWAADFDEQFAGLVASFDAFTGDQSEGRLDQIAGTAGLKATAKAGVKAVRNLDAIMSRRLASDAGLLAAWKAATHIQAEPEREDEPAAPPAVPVAIQGHPATVGLSTTLAELNGDARVSGGSNEGEVAADGATAPALASDRRGEGNGVLPA